jgi:McbB family protein
MGATLKPLDRMFFINDFTINLIGGECITSTRRMICRINDNKMKLLIEQLERMSPGKIHEIELIRICEQLDLPSESAINYLATNSGIIRDISRISGAQKQVDNVRLFSDIPDLEPLVTEAASKEGVLKISVEPLHQAGKEPVDNTLVCLLMAAYSPRPIEAAYNAYLSTAGVQYLTGYFAGSKLLIDGLYDRENGTPCHFCHMERWINLDNTSLRAQSSWVSLMAGFAERDGQGIPLTPIARLDVLFATHIFIRQLLYFAGYPEYSRHLDRVYSMTVVDPINCTTTSEVVSHWPNCKCGHEESSV